MTRGWLDSRAVRLLCGTLAAIQVLVALANLAYIPSEQREYAAWQTHVESPEVAAPAPEPPARANWKREIRREIKQQLDLDRECNFTTWLSSMQSTLIAFTCLLLCVQSRRRQWLLLVAGFLYLSMDELCQVHEWVGFQISESGFRLGALGPPYPWIVVLGPLFLAYGVGALWFLHRELRGSRRLQAWTLAGLLLMASSLPLEVIGGEMQGGAPRPPRLEVIAEETLETLGGTVLLYVLLTLLIARSQPAAEAPAAGRATARGMDARRATA